MAKKSTKRQTSAVNDAVEETIDAIEAIGLAVNETIEAIDAVGFAAERIVAAALGCPITRALSIVNRIGLSAIDLVRAKEAGNLRDVIVEGLNKAND